MSSEEGGRGPARGGSEPGAAADGEVEILGFEAVDEDGHGSGEFLMADAEPLVEPAAPVADSAELAPLQAENAELRTRQLRLLADFDNFRKRADRERDERVRFALADPIRELLPVVDNLERALAAQGQLEDLRSGVEMTLRQLGEVLRRLGIEAVPAVGERFDPRVHEAVMSVESPDVAVPTVIDEFQRGYKLHERLLRPAMVRVAVPTESGEAPAGSEAPRGGAEDA